LVDAAAMVKLLAGVFVDPLAGDAKYSASQAVTLAHTSVVSLGPATSARRHRAPELREQPGISLQSDQESSSSVDCAPPLRYSCGKSWSDDAQTLDLAVRESECRRFGEVHDHSLSIAAGKRH
jgi:hypothetical protein